MTQHTYQIMKKKNQKIIKNFTFNKVTKSELNLLANKILNL